MSHKGFKYEKNAADVLKTYSLVPSNFEPAGARGLSPDLLLSYQNIETGCELKMCPASAGSLVLKYDDGWSFGKIKEDEDEKIFIRDLAHDVKLFDQIEEKWPAVPYNRTKDLEWKETIGKLSQKERYEYDKANFPDIRGEISAEAIEAYYNKKDTFYVNVGTHGFYRLGNTNPLSLSSLPAFSEAARAVYRARVQYKGKYRYQFTFEMNFSIRGKGEYNIAPIDGKSVDILKDNLSLGCFNINTLK